MSTRKGNSKKKGQKYQNTVAFKNDLHDKSRKTKEINSLVVTGVCARCREVIEWRKKFKKYKPLTAPKKCVKCLQKTVIQAYHIMCSKCAGVAKVCEKCGEEKEIMAKSMPSSAEKASQESMLQQEIKAMSERQRRTYFRHLEKGDQGKEAKRSTSQAAGSSSNESDLSSDENEDELSEPESIDQEDVTGS
ncbi:Uncharacterized protein P5673_023023 [Acropora cervicornis]|uniref:Uncharacterized protein n=1 Tax=Acropora cervicornis TaxID=6130 RepID=A0AAD9Q608_ACRCE|nr:Uncharacterized protein P5673_023023 [Acropora cervicornis]